MGAGVRKPDNIPSFGLLALLTVAMPSAAVAQITDDGLLHEAVGAPDNWHLSGSVRARFEAIDGQFRKDAVTRDQVLTLRTTLFPLSADPPIGHWIAEPQPSRHFTGIRR